MEDQAGAQPSADRAAQDSDLVELGRLHYRQGELEAALSCFTRAYDQCKAAGDQSQLAEIANDIGVVYTVRGEWAQAERWLNEAQRLFVALQDFDGEAQALGNMGSMFRARGDLRLAAANLQLAAGRFRLVNDCERQSVTLKALGAVRLRQLRFFQALAAYEAAFACQPHPSLLDRLLRPFVSLPARMMQR
jgi:tetratricopeptide (TPR) repeat protein